MNIQRSVGRAQELLGAPGPDGFSLFKLHSVGCACTHCWPHTWAEINRHLEPQGPIGHEGTLVIRAHDEAFVLEGHESGPEIFAYVGASAGVVSAITSLVSLFIQFRRREGHGAGHPLRLTVTHSVRGDVDSDLTIDLEIPSSCEVDKAVAEFVSNGLRSTPNKRVQSDGKAAADALER